MIFKNVAHLEVDKNTYNGIYAYILILGRTCCLRGCYFIEKTQKRKAEPMKAVHGEKSCLKQHAERVVTKRWTELLCEIEALELVVESLEQEDVINNNEIMNLPNEKTRKVSTIACL